MHTAGDVDLRVISLSALLELPSAAASDLFPFDGDSRPMGSAFSSISVASTGTAATATAGVNAEVCHLSRLPLSSMAGVHSVLLEDRMYLVSIDTL